MQHFVGSSARGRGVKIGRYAVIGANAVATRDVSNSFIASSNDAAAHGAVCALSNGAQSSLAKFHFDANFPIIRSWSCRSRS
jgi:hypothetical protein